MAEGFGTIMMERSMARWVVLFPAMAAYSGPAVAQRSGPELRSAGLLCQPAETVLFSCTVDRKVVSVCGKGDRQAVYRFGRPGHVEIEVSELHYASTGLSGGGEAQVQADAPGARYIVYTETHRTAFGADGRNDPKSSAGLVVQIEGKIVSRHQCVVEGSFDSGTEALLPAGEYVEH